MGEGVLGGFIGSLSGTDEVCGIEVQFPFMVNVEDPGSCPRLLLWLELCRYLDVVLLLSGFLFVVLFFRKGKYLV